MSSVTPPFCSMIRASGLSEIWTHKTDDLKFRQFGWRCTNLENEYTTDTLVGNWNEERFDIKRMQKAKPLPSQFGHYYETNYGSSFNKTQDRVPTSLKNLKSRHSYAYPGHQPELDTPKLRAVYNSFETTSRAAYLSPNIRREPLLPPIGGSSS